MFPPARQEYNRIVDDVKYDKPDTVYLTGVESQPSLKEIKKK